MDLTTSPFLNSVLNGRINTTDEWHTYFETFHRDNPTANDLFITLRNYRAETSYDVLAQRVLSHGGDVLEIACGDGHLVEAISDAMDASRGTSVVALDVCRAELDIAVHRHGNSIARFDHAAAESLPYEDASFDVVTSHQFFNFLPRPLGFLAEAVRVLKPGGWFIFAMNRGWLKDRSTNWVTLHELAKARLNEFYPSMIWPNMSDARIYSDEGIEQILRAVLGLNTATLEIHHFSVSAMMTPARMAEVYNRLYLFASVPERREILDAVEAKAEEIAGSDGALEIAIPFRLVSIRKR